MRRRRLLLLPFLLVALLAAIAVAGWRWAATPPPAWPPDEGWTARVVTIAEARRFTQPFGIAAAPNGAVIVAEGGDANRLVVLAPDGTATLLAGGREGFADGRGAAAAFHTPSALAVGPDGAIYVADTGNHAIRRVTPDGVVTTVAGTGTPGFRDGPARDAQFNGPIGVAVDASGRIVVADTYNDRVRAIDPGGEVRTLAGSGGPGRADGPGTFAAFDTPCGVAVASDGVIYVADTGNSVIRLVTPDGLVSTPVLESADGSLGSLRQPVGVAVAGPDHLIVADRRDRVVEIRQGRARILAGGSAGFADGQGRDARFRSPSGVALSGEAGVVVADTGNGLVRRIDSAARLAADVMPPAPPRVRAGFDAEAFAALPLLWPVAPLDGPHEVAGTMGEARGNAGGEGRERFHAGVDIRAEDGAEVRAVRDGKVEDPLPAGGFGSLGEYVAIGPLTYVHLRVGRLRGDGDVDPSRFLLQRDDRGRATAVRVRRGTRVRTGDVIGSVNRFYHVHLNVGPPGEEVNPLLIGLPGFTDTIAPTIEAGGIRVFGEDGVPLEERRQGRVVVRGRVRIAVSAFDRADLNPPRRRLGLYELGYQVLQADGVPVPGFAAPRSTLVFDRLPADADAPLRVYAEGSGIPFYGARVTRFRYLVTTTMSGGRVTEELWDTTALPAGDYVVRVFAADASGNRVSADLPVTVDRTAGP